MTRRAALPTMLGALVGALALWACGGGSAEVEYRTLRSPPLMDLSVPPEPGAPRPFDLPRVHHFVLGNGLSVYLVDRDGFPTVSVELSIDAGYAATADNLALAELVTRTLRDGAGDLDAGAVSRLVDANGIAFAATVDHDRTRLSASSLSTSLAATLDLLGTLVASPRFADERVVARRDELVGELELAASQPDFHLARASRRAIYPADHPYRDAAPSVEQVRAVDGAAVRDAWAERWGPAISRLVVVGDLPDDIRARVQDAFVGWTGGPTERAAIPPTELNTCNVAHVVARPNSAQTSIAWLGPGRRTGARQWFAALLANHVLGGGPSSRLFMNLREDKSYTYGAYSRLEQWGDGVFRAASNVRSDVTGPALDEFAAEFARFADGPLDDLEDARAYLSGVFPIEHQTNPQLASALARLLDQQIGVEYLESYREHVGSVSEPAVREAGAELFDPGALTLVLVGEYDAAVQAAAAHSARVFVYDLTGALVETLDGQLEASCPDGAQPR